MAPMIACQKMLSAAKPVAPIAGQSLPPANKIAEAKIKKPETIAVNTRRPK